MAVKEADKMLEITRWEKAENKPENVYINPKWPWLLNTACRFGLSWDVQKYTVELERRRVTRRMIRLQYKQQLDHLQLFSLEYNQARGMIQYGYKIKSCIKNEYKMNIDFFYYKRRPKKHQATSSGSRFQTKKRRQFPMQHTVKM